MNKQPFTPSEARSPQAQNAFLIAMLIVVSHLVAAAFYLYLFKTSDITQFYKLAIVSVVLGVLFVVGAVLSRRGQSTQGMILVLGILAASYPPVTLLASGLGLVLGLALMVVGPIAAFQTLPRRSSQIMTLITLGSGIATVLLDVLGSAARPQLPGILIPLLAGSVIILLGYYMVRQSYRILRNVSYKLISSVVIVLVVIAGFQILFSDRATRQNLEQEAEDVLVSYFQTYQTKIETELVTAESLAISIAARDDIKELYLSGKRDELYSLLSPMFTEWKDRHIVHLYIENPDGTVFLRVHNPEKFGDDITYRGTANTALSEKRVTSGVEIGPNRLGVRGVAPMYGPNGEFIGLAEVGVDFDERFVEALKKSTSADFTMWVLHEAAAVPNLKPVEGVPAAPIEELFYYTGTNPDILTVSPDVYRSVLQTGNPIFQVVTRNTPVPYTMYITPLLGYNDKVLGLLQISETYTEHLEAQNRALLATLGVTTGLTILGLLIFWLLSTRLVIKPVTLLSQFATRQMAGETDSRVSVVSGDEFQQLAETFNSMASSVEQEHRYLEQRVAERTKALATSVEVSRRLSTILNERQLIIEVVEQVKAAFDYYHVHIYLLDEATGDLMMAGGTGDVGAAMLGSGHKILKGKGLVGRAAETNIPVLVTDTSNDPNWLPHPLLPETASEAAVPIAIADKLIGVLDVQHNNVGGLKQEDIDLLQSIANQVAIALLNARSYTVVQQRADREARITSIGQKIQSTTSIEGALQVAVRELGRTLGANEIQVILDAPGLAKSSQKPDRITS
jgi:putative methionine-R-sulfoxide reductase with GAF domain